MASSFLRNVVYFQSHNCNKRHQSDNLAHEFRERCELQGFPLRKRSGYFTCVYWACVSFSWLSRVQSYSCTTWSSPSSDPPRRDVCLTDGGPSSGRADGPAQTQTLHSQAETAEPVDMTMISKSFPFDLKCIHYSGRPITKIESVECIIHTVLVKSLDPFSYYVSKLLTGTV